jgi:hypothetical protein
VRSEIRRVSARIAEAVAAEARDSGVGRAISDEDISRLVAAAMRNPAYLPMVPSAEADVDTGRLSAPSREQEACARPA